MSMPKASNTRWTLSLIALMTLAGCVGLSILSKMQGYPWHKIFSSPDKSPEILAAGIFDIYLRTQEGRIYSCEIDPLRCKEVSIEEVSLYEQRRSTLACTPNEYNPPVPGTVVASRIVCQYADVFPITRRYIILDDGSVWTWGGFMWIPYPVVMVMPAILGGLIGFSTGAVIILAKRSIRKT